MHFLKELRRVQIGELLGGFVGIGSKVEQLNGLYHIGIHGLVCSARIDCVPASLTGSPDVHASVLILAVGELFDVCDVYGLTPVVGLAEQKVADVLLQGFQLSRDSKWSVGASMEEVAWFGSGIQAIVDERVLDDKDGPVVRVCQRRVALFEKYTLVV